MNLFNSIRNHKTIVKNTGYLSLIEIMRLILPFVALPYVIRTIGADKYGTIVFAQTVVSYFIIFINFGLDVSAVKDVAIHRNDKAKLNKVVSSVLAVKLMLCCISFLILVVGILFIPYLMKERLLYFYAFFTCFSEILFPVWFYQGIEKMKYLTMIRLVSILFYTSTVFIFVHEPKDYVNVALLQSVGFLLSGCISFYVLLKIEHVKLLIPKYSDLKHCFVDSIPFFMSRVSVVLNNGMAKIISGIFFSMSAVAAFDLAQKMATAALIPMQMMNQAVYPHIAKTRSISFVRKYLKVNVLLSLLVAIAVCAIAPYVVCFFSGNQLNDSILLLRILCVWIFVGGITSYIGAPVLVSFGYPKPFNNSVVLSTISLLIIYLVCYFTGIFSIYYFAWVLVFSEVIILFYRLYYCLHLKIFSFYGFFEKKI